MTTDPKIVGKIVSPKGNSANVRKNPDTKEKIVVVLKKGQKMYLSGNTIKGNDGYTWYGVTNSTLTTRGWVREDVIVVSENPNYKTPETNKNGANTVTVSSKTDANAPDKQEVQKELDKLVAQLKSIYKKATVVYNILVAHKKGTYKLPEDINYVSLMNTLQSYNAQYTDLNNELQRKKEIQCTIVKYEDVVIKTMTDTTYQNPVHTIRGLGAYQVAIGIAIAAVILVSTYVIYQFIQESRKKAEVIDKGLDGIISKLRKEGVPDNVIKKVTPQIETVLDQTYTEGKKEGASGGMFADVKKTLTYAGIGALAFIALPYVKDAVAGKKGNSSDKPRLTSSNEQKKLGKVKIKRK